MKDKFNKYCAEVMGYEILADGDMLMGVLLVDGIIGDYNPYDNLNQMAEVVEKLAPLQHRTFIGSMTGVWMGAVKPSTIKECLRNFIISTMEKDDE